MSYANEIAIGIYLMRNCECFLLLNLYMTEYALRRLSCKLKNPGDVLGCVPEQ